MLPLLASSLSSIEGRLTSAHLNRVIRVHWRGFLMRPRLDEFSSYKLVQTKMAKKHSKCMLIDIYSDNNTRNRTEWRELSAENPIQCLINWFMHFILFYVFTFAIKPSIDPLISTFHSIHISLFSLTHK